MLAMLRLPQLPLAALLLAGAPFALAESPMPDPVPPAVIGRPLDQLGPAKPRSLPAKPARARPVATNAAAATQLATTTPAQAAFAAPVQEAPATRHVAKQALDDRADARMQLNEVGKGTHFARKPLAEGAYFGERYRSAARKYYEEHPVLRPAVKWKIGEPVPRDAVVAAVPRGLLAALPQVPPGHQYVELGGEVVLIAAESRMVVDGISRNRAQTASLSR